MQQNTLAAELAKRHQVLKTKRQSEIEPTWAECFNFTLPLRGDGLDGSNGSSAAAANNAKNGELTDSTAADCTQILASNIMSSITPASSLWFAMDVGNETDEERRWLDDAAKLLWENIHMANFDAEAFEAILDMVIAGLFALYVDEDRERGGLSFQQWPLAECYFGSSRADGRIDTVHREYTLTAEQAVKEFGDQAPPRAITAVAAGKGDETLTYVHAIYPRKGKPGKFAKNLPIASCQIELESKHLCRESGYHEMPLICPRWARLPRSIYAVGPIYPALPNIRTLNDLKALELDAADIAVSGMWIVEDDGVINTRTVKVGPRKMIIAASVDSMKPLTTGSDFNLSETLVAQLQAAIRKVMMADQLQPQDGPQMTATEIRVRVEMIRKLLGPIFGRLQAEYLKPLIERTFGLAYRAGIFKPPPASLLNREFSIRYVSPMARAQKLDDVNAIQDVFTAAAQMVPIVPEIMDELDPSEALRLMVEGLGAPNSIRRDKADVEKIRADRQEAQQRVAAQAALQNAQAVGAEAAAKNAAAPA